MPENPVRRVEGTRLQNIDSSHNLTQIRNRINTDIIPFAEDLARILPKLRRVKVRQIKQDVPAVRALYRLKRILSELPTRDD